MRTLNFALEDDNFEVVKGMFTAAPIGQKELKQAEALESNKALDELDAALEALDNRAEPLGAYNGKITTQVALEGVKEVLKKIWELIAKVLAAIAGLMTGFLGWLAGNHKRRGLTREIYRAFLEAEVMFTKILSGVTYGDLFNATIKADKFDVSIAEQMSPIEFDAYQDGPYAKAVVEIIGLIGEKDFSHALKDFGSDLSEKYKELLEEAQRVDISGKPPANLSGEKTAVVPVGSGSLATFSAKVDKELGGNHHTYNDKLEALTEVTDKAKKALEGAHASKQKLEPDYQQWANRPRQVVNEVPYELVLRFKDEYSKIFKDTTASVKQAEERFTKGQWIDEKTIEDETLIPATTYLNRAMLEVIRNFGKGVQGVAHAFLMVDDQFRNALSMSLKLYKGMLAVINTFDADHMDPHMLHFAAILQMRMQMAKLIKEVEKNIFAAAAA